MSSLAEDYAVSRLADMVRGGTEAELRRRREERWEQENRELIEQANEQLENLEFLWVTAYKMLGYNVNPGKTKYNSKQGREIYYGDDELHALRRKRFSKGELVDFVKKEVAEKTYDYLYDGLPFDDRDEMEPYYYTRRGVKKLDTLIKKIISFMEQLDEVRFLMDDSSLERFAESPSNKKKELVNPVQLAKIAKQDCKVEAVVDEEDSGNLSSLSLIPTSESDLESLLSMSDLSSLESASSASKKKSSKKKSSKKKTNEKKSSKKKTSKKKSSKKKSSEKKSSEKKSSEKKKKTMKKKPTFKMNASKLRSLKRRKR